MTKMNLAQFNTQFRKMLDKIAILEGGSKAQAVIPAYLEMVDLLLAFIKSSDCPIQLRPKYIAVSKGYIQKIKNLQGESPEKKLISQPSTIPPAPAIGSTISETDFDALPAIPMNAPEDDVDLPPPPNSSPATQVNPSPNESPKSVPTPSSSPSATPFSSPPDSGDKANYQPAAMDDFLGKLKRFEEELKQLPDGVKEVKPFNFDLNSILNPSATNPANLDEFKKDTITLDITSQNIGDLPSHEKDPSGELKSNTAPSFKIKGFSKDPFAKTDQIGNNLGDSKKDPFANPELPENKLNGGSSNTCYACGVTLPPGAKICPSCGANLT
jgi:hypothetical protein